MKNSKSKLLAILGPTASGKSDLAVLCAQKWNGLNRPKEAVDRTSQGDVLGEVISADSRQIYRGLDVGSGKIIEEEMDGVPHHLLNVADPNERFSVVDFKEQSEKAITDIVNRGKLPIIAGGTGFYIRAVVDDTAPPSAPFNAPLREKLSKKSTEELFTLLEKKDPQRAKAIVGLTHLDEVRGAKEQEREAYYRYGERSGDEGNEEIRQIRKSYIEKGNPRRLIRALEIVEHLGKVPKRSVAPPPDYSKSPYDVLQIGLSVPKEQLRENIRIRTVDRMEKGFVEEVARLMENEVSLERMREFGLGYRCIAEWLTEKNTRSDAFSSVLKNTRTTSNSNAYWDQEMIDCIETSEWRYAKRQMTWFKRDQRIEWFSPNDKENIFQKVQLFLEQ